MELRWSGRLEGLRPGEAASLEIRSAGGAGGRMMRRPGKSSGGWHGQRRRSSGRMREAQIWPDLDHGRSSEGRMAWIGRNGGLRWVLRGLRSRAPEMEDAWTSMGSVARRRRRGAATSKRWNGGPVGSARVQLAVMEPYRPREPQSIAASRRRPWTGMAFEEDANRGGDADGGNGRRWDARRNLVGLDRGITGFLGVSWEMSCRGFLWSGFGR